MKRIVLVGLLCAGLVGGCKCSETRPAEQAAPESAVVAAPVSDREPGGKIRGRRRAPRFGEAEIIKYRELQEYLIEPYRAALEEWKPGAPTNPGPDGMLAAFNADPKVQERLKEALVEGRERVGLDLKVERGVTALYRAVGRSRALFEKSGGEQALAEAQTKLASLGAEDDAGRAELEQAVATLRGLREAEEARERYSDETVAAMLEHHRSLEEIAERKAALGRLILGD